MTLHQTPFCDLVIAYQKLDKHLLSRAVLCPNCLLYLYLGLDRARQRRVHVEEMQSATTQ